MIELEETTWNDFPEEAKQNNIVKFFENYEGSVVHNYIKKDGVTVGIFSYEEMADDYILGHVLYIYGEFRQQGLGSELHDYAKSRWKTIKGMAHSDIAREAVVRRGWKKAAKGDKIYYTNT